MQSGVWNSTGNKHVVRGDILETTEEPRLMPGLPYSSCDALPV
jgi:hypothetical protein